MRRRRRADGSTHPMILLIDNEDSFVYNLARYIADLGGDPLVRRRNLLTVSAVEHMAPSHIVISPGPRSPREAGVAVEVIRRLGPTIPILGVCLGHQCIGAAYGLRIIRAAEPRHGKASEIHHRGRGLFRGLPNPFSAARYHSLVIDPTTVYGDLEVTATSEDGVIMGISHRHHPVVGVQFHPESVLTSYGYHLLHRFLFPDREMPTDLSVKADMADTREGSAIIHT